LTSPFRLGVTVDWDFFLSDGPTDAHDCPAYDLDAWVLRGAQTLDPAYSLFWKRLPFSYPSAGLVTRSHIDALPYFTGCDLIFTCDQHSDLYGLPQEHPYQFSSGNWLCGTHCDIIHCSRPDALSAFIQKLREALDKRTGKLLVDRLHICRSDPWSHPQYDSYFREFLRSCPCPLYVAGLADQPRVLPSSPDSIFWTASNWSDLLKRCITFYRFL
jgi:hypothetical protein